MNKSVESLLSQLDEEKRKSDLIRKVSFELTKISPLLERLNNILELLETSFNLTHSILLIPQENNTALKIIASRGFDQDGVGVKIPFDYGFVGTVATKRKKIRISRLSQLRRYAEANDHQRSVEIGKLGYPYLANAESQVVLPLIANDELVAVLSVESENILFFSLKEEELLMTLSHQMALSIQNSIVYEQLEKRVKNRTQALENLNKTKDQLFSIIAHDLRSPMSALEGVSELVDYYTAQEKFDQLHSLGSKIGHTVQNITQLLDNLLNWSLAQQGGIKSAPRNIDLAVLLDEVRGIFNDHLSAKHISLFVANCEGISIYADYTMIFSVFRNIVSNAIKFTPTEGEIHLSAFQKNDKVQVIIKDTGVGISEPKLSSVFSLQNNKSELGTNREKGSGLGLVLVKEFMDRINGTVEIKSADQGTTVILLIPQA
ncbi:MAG: signal transduction histidine kinase [Roseivirga sp.]|jgi:signal transduction histidine kinase